MTKTKFGGNSQSQVVKKEEENNVDEARVHVDMLVKDQVP
jgi:hypothetical protein